MRELGARAETDAPEGREGLRSLIAERLNARGANVSSAEVIITNGSHEALSLILDVLGAERVEVDRATSPGALELFKAHRCHAIAGTRQALRYAMPSLHSPFGWSLGASERESVLESHLIIEDDAFAELRFDGLTPAPLLQAAPKRVFHVGSFSKTVSPELRVGYVVAPPHWLGLLRAAKAARQVQGNGVAQAIVQVFLERHDFDARLATLRAHYAKRAQVLLNLLPSLPTVRFWVPQGGFSVWLETDVMMPDEAFRSLALQHGVSVDIGSRFQASGQRTPGLAMRLCFSSVPVEQMAVGVQRLGSCLARARRSNRN